MTAVLYGRDIVSLASVQHPRGPSCHGAIHVGVSGRRQPPRDFSRFRLPGAVTDVRGTV